jgi:ketoreductase RED2
MESRVALVIGASSGMGAAIAARLASDGMRVAVSSARNGAAGEAVAAALPDAVYVQADAGSKADMDRAVDEVVDRYGRLDVLVYAAGRTQRVPHRDLDAVTEEMWREILDVNLLGAWWATRAATPHLRVHGSGNIVLLGSLGAVQAGGSSIPYSVSKAALHHLCVLLAASLGPEIRVNTVAPGFVRTPWTAGWDALAEEMSARAPLRRIGEPDEIAEVVSGLLRSTYVTGQIILADGGFHVVP